MKQYYVYILANIARTLYVGVTNDLERRSSEHKSGELEGFSKRYTVNRVIYYDATDDVTAAIQREKQLKGWTRAKKIALIESENPSWRDLATDWGGAPGDASLDAQHDTERSSQGPVAP